MVEPKARESKLQDQRGSAHANISPPLVNPGARLIGPPCFADAAAGK
ncbi:MAG: hypothetical protein WCF57_03175 [Pyrinomonadaceae bacterium]